MTFSPTSAEPLRSAALKTSARASAMFTSFDEKLRRPRKLRLRVVLPPLPLPASLSRSELRTEKESPGLKLSGLTAVISSACLPSEIRRSANIDGRCVAALNARNHARFAGVGSAEPCACERRVLILIDFLAAAGACLIAATARFHEALAAPALKIFRRSDGDRFARGVAVTCRVGVRIE